jgi:chromosome segregation and condensation protein ScpB
VSSKRRTPPEAPSVKAAKRARTRAPAAAPVDAAPEPGPVAEADSLDGFRVRGKRPRKTSPPAVTVPVVEAAPLVEATPVVEPVPVVEAAVVEAAPVVEGPAPRPSKRARKASPPVVLAPPVEAPAAETPVTAEPTPAPPATPETEPLPVELESVALAEAALVEAALEAPALAEASPLPAVDALAPPVVESAPAPPPLALDPAAERAVMDAAIAAIEGARPRNLEMQLEALLFSTSSPLTEDELAAALLVSRDEAVRALRALERTLETRPSSIALWSRPKGGQPAYILDVKAPFRRDVAALAPPALRVALVETLALIALNQPVSQRRLVAERGGTVYEHVRELGELGYVQKQRKGINFYLKTTATFASEFGLPDEPELIRQALAKAAGLSGATSAITSNRVWMQGEPPPELQASMAEAQAVAAEAARVAAAAEEAEAARLAAEAAAAEAAAVAAAEAAAAAAATAAAEAAAREAQLAAEAEAAAKLAAEMAKAPAEDCLVAGAEATPLGKGKKKRRAVASSVANALAEAEATDAPAEAPDPLRDVLSGLGGSGLAW